MSKIAFDPNKYSRISILSTDRKRVIAQLIRKKATDAEWAFLLQDLANVQDPDEEPS